MNRYNFIDTVKKEESKTIYLFTDGSCAPTNPGPGGFGIYCCDEFSNKVFAISSYVGNLVTNNQMEYLALLMGVRSLRSKAIHGKYKGAHFFTDSRILVITLKNWKKDPMGNNPVLTQLRSMIIEEMEKSPIPIDVQWINREQNEKADILSKAGSAGNTTIDGINLSPEAFEKSAFDHLLKAMTQANKFKKQAQAMDDDIWF